MNVVARLAKQAFITLRRSAAIALLATPLAPAVLSAWSPAQEAAYEKFQQEFDAGADCQRLFELRLQFRVPSNASPQEEAANKKLRSVGCFDSSSHRKPVSTGSRDGHFTVKEYRVLRAILATPMSVPHQQALASVGAKFGMPPDQVKRIANKVEQDLFENGWLGAPEAEIRHASDWAGETQ